MTTAITIRDVTKSFGPGSMGGRARAVDQISLRIEAGELFFLLGPSGCGKTTLLRMIAGFIEPTSGSILFNDKDVTAVPPNKRNTGMVFQSYALWPHMTVEANVAFGLDVRKVTGTERAERVGTALRSVHMGEYALRKPNQLSGGQQQRIALARALVIRPDVLLLDEPLSNLDAKLRLELRSEIRRVCKATGITTVYVTHDQKEALSMADRMAVLDQGRVVQIGTPTDLYRHPRSRFVAEFLGEANFIDGIIVETNNTACRVRTAAGELAARRTDLPANQRVTVAVRPEAVRISTPQHQAGTAWSARIVDSTYLGETAQHAIDLGNNIRWTALDLNPSQTRRTGEVRVSIDPEDVMILSSAGD